MKTQRNIVLILAFLMIVWQPRYSEAATEYSAVIRLIDSIAVRAPLVCLGEIANIESKSGELQKQLANVVIGTAPSIGNTSVISSYKIKSILNASGFNDFKLYGFQSAISTEFRDVTGSEIKGVVEEWVRKNSQNDADIEFKFSSVPSLWRIPKGEKVEIRIQDRGKRKLSGAVYLSLRSFSEERIFSTAHVRVNISLFKESLVLTRPLKKGDVLKGSDVEWRRSEVTRAKGMEVVSLDSVLGKVLKRDLRIGTLVSVKDFELPVAIERGTMNRIVIINGSVKMNVVGAEALQNGKKGDTILFNNPLNPKRRLHAKVIETGIAMIEMK